ncbi:MAG TPA: hypothetical protein VGB54_10545 [Allosphingosinicella sp.]
MKSETIRIGRRFRGPPDSGNGGYVAGMVARSLGGSHCTVTLLRPPPLDRDLWLESDGAGARLLDGEEAIATAVRGQVAVDVPPPPSVEGAQAASARFAGLRHHIFPGCFVCGPERAAGDGLRIFAGPVAGGSEQVAARWSPDESCADAEGRLRVEMIWAALDCPGYFAVQDKAGVALLGRQSVALHAPARIEPMIVTGWAVQSEGRKHRVGTALHREDGVLVAASAATWISPAA